jgi:hypothetical protein
MMLAAKLMRMMTAAIALIAVQFMALPAQAHVGHGHMHGHGLHAHAHHHAAAVYQQAGPADADRAAQPAELRSADQQPMGASDTGNGCVGGCCGSGVSCCGGTVLAPVADQTPPSVRSSSIQLERDAITAGIDPDALRKPPRSLI